MSVSIRKGADIRKNLEEVFAELSFVPGKRVYIKPNLCGRSPVMPGENTSTAVMDALIDMFVSRGCSVTIGHGALLGTRGRQTSFEQTLRESGFTRYLSRPGVQVVNLDLLERTRVDIDGSVFHLPLRFLKEELDSYINLAKIKSHMETGVSLSLKNQMGLPAPEDRRLMHKTGLDLAIARLGLACRPDLSILEGYPAMEGNGPHHGSPRNMALIAAGTDLVELDSLVAGLLGYRADEISHVSQAARIAVGSKASPALQSRFENYAVPDFKRANAVFRFGRNYFV